MSYSGTRVIPFASAAEIIAGVQAKKAIDPEQLSLAALGLVTAENDTAASIAGVAVGHLYRTGNDPSVICIRVS